VTPYDDHVPVAVEGDGPDAPTDLLGRVIDPFVTTRTPGEGTGLGPHLVHHIITARHGEGVEVSSRPGRTRFVVNLPAERSANG
jgi:two-component system, NtrC family, sensor kinase